MNKNKRQAKLFFDSNSTMMANQIRQLVTDSIIQFRDFFRRFKKEKYLTAGEII